MTSPFENIESDLDSIAMTDAYVLTKRFKTSEEFSKYIETTAMKRGEPLIHTVLEFCEMNDIDENIIAKLISPSLKDKIQVEAQEDRKMESEDGQLDI